MHVIFEGEDPLRGGEECNSLSQTIRILAPDIAQLVEHLTGDSGAQVQIPITFHLCTRPVHTLVQVD